MIRKILYRSFLHVPVHTWLLLGAMVWLGYWPVSTNLFSLKNDAYIYFLPCRHFISEQLRHGHLPLWDPYFYMGFPLHGDMQGSVWNPFVWLFSLFTSYNMTTLQYETLLYILLAGIGMFKLLDLTKSSYPVRLLLAVSYMFCGFIIDTGQITVWTASAAFLPFVFLYYFRILQANKLELKTVIKASLAIFLLFTTGYPSFLFMCLYIFIAGTLFMMMEKKRSGDLNQTYLFGFIKNNALLLAFFLLLSLPALLSYIDYLPYFQRSGGVSFSEAAINPFNPFAFISYLFPFSVTKSHHLLTTDPTARSGFIGLFSMMGLLFILKGNQTRIKIYLALIIGFVLLFSVGDAFPLRKICYDHLPLMNLFRHPGTMRIFTTIGLLVLVSIPATELLNDTNLKKTKLLLYSTGFFTLVILGILVYYLKDTSLVATISGIWKLRSTGGDIRSGLKSMFDSIGFADAILIEGILQLIFLAWFAYVLLRKKAITSTNILFIFILNVILLAQLSIPSTFVTRQSPALINRFIAAAPKDYPHPSLNTSINENNSAEHLTNKLYGCSSFYTKKIVQVEDELNPSFTKSLQLFDGTKILSNTVMQYPVCYLADTMIAYADTGKILPTDKKILFVNPGELKTINAEGTSNNSIQIQQFNPQELSFTINHNSAGPFVVFQNYNANWKATIDGKSIPILTGNLSFMYVMVEAGSHQLNFKYQPAYIVWSTIVSGVSLIFFLCVLLFRRRQDPENAQQ